MSVNYPLTVHLCVKQNYWRPQKSHVRLLWTKQRELTHSLSLDVSENVLYNPTETKNEIYPDKLLFLTDDI